MASLSELIEEIGNENVTVQTLHNSMDKADYNKGHTKITFGTDGLSPNDLVDNKKTALIVWVDSDRFDKALSKFK